MEMNAPILTILIPTYNRNEKLQRTLSILEPQLSNKVKIKIIDNCSPNPVSDTLIRSPDAPIEIIRNQQNIGLSANLIKCFEFCDTEWMWLLGDDDPPMSDAVLNILEDIAVYSECAFLNYKSALASNRKSSFQAVGIEELIDKIDDFGNFLFISVGLYNLKNLRGNLRLTYQLAYSLAPYLVYILTGIQSDTKVMFLNKEILDLSLHNTSRDDSWSWLTLGLCLPVLYEIPLNIDQRTKKKFGDFILTHIKSPKAVFSILEQPSYYNLPTYEKRFLLRQIYFRSLLTTGLSLSLLEFIWYDCKLLIKNILIKRNILINDERYKRI